MKKTICIIQARTGSTRLPEKVLKKIHNKAILSHVIERVRKASKIDNIVIATTEKEQDKKIVELCLQENVLFFRGSEEDVLARYYYAAIQHNAEIVIRVTSDCPLIDPKLIDTVIDFYNSNDFDYVCIPIDDGMLRGLDCEVFSFTSLEKSFFEARERPSREHVTHYMYTNPDKFVCGCLPLVEDFFFPGKRVCVDTIEDFQLVTHIYDIFYNGNKIVNMVKVSEYLKKNEHIFIINENIKQKKV